MGAIFSASSFFSHTRMDTWPPLLLAPSNSFAWDESLMHIASSIMKNRTDVQRCVLSATDCCNINFFVSSVDASVMDAVTAALAPWAKGAVALVLGFPTNAYAIREDGRPIHHSEKARLAAIADQGAVAYTPYRWNQRCTDILTARIAHFHLAYTKSRTALQVYEDGVKERDALKCSLQSELARTESLEKEVESLTRRARRIEAAHRKRCDDRDKAAAHAMKATIATLARELEGADEMAVGRQNGESPASELPDDDIADSVVLRVALQCRHYFAYDRFSSEHMRKQIAWIDGEECFPIAALAAFPRMVELCGGDAKLIVRACRLLELRVRDETWIVFSSPTGR